MLRISPARACAAYVDTYVELRSAIVTVMAVLALAYVMNRPGRPRPWAPGWPAPAAPSPSCRRCSGWLGVAVTGSDTSSNSLFGALQVTAAKAGLDPVLHGRLEQLRRRARQDDRPQNLAIAAAAVGMAGGEGELFRRVLGWSLLLLAFMC